MYIKWNHKESHRLIHALVKWIPNVFFNTILAEVYVDFMSCLINSVFIALLVRFVWNQYDFMRVGCTLLQIRVSLK